MFPALMLDEIHYNVLLGLNWLVQTKADLNLKNMLLNTDRENIRISSYSNPIANLWQINQRSLC